MISFVNSDSGPVAHGFFGMLRDHLQTHWDDIRDHPIFRKAEFLEACAKPLTSDDVLRAVQDTDCEDLLEGLRPCLRELKPDDRASHAFQTLTLIALAGTHRFIHENAELRSALPHTDTDPICVDDFVVACVMAASAFNFGLRFDPGQASPRSVHPLTLPSPEPGCPGEEGHDLVRKELAGFANRIDLGMDVGSDKAFYGITDRRLQRLLRRAAEVLRCEIALCASSTGQYADEAARAELIPLIQDWGVRVFFHRQTPDAEAAVQNLLKELGQLLMPILVAHSNSPKTEAPMPTDKPDSQSPIVNNNFYAPVNHVTQANAPGAQAAGHDIVNVHKVTTLHKHISALNDAISNHARLSDDKKELMQGCVDEIKVLADKHEPTQDDASRAKRCLERLKQAADAVEDGNTILTKLQPVWDGLKAAWPAVAAIFS